MICDLEELKIEADFLIDAYDNALRMVIHANDWVESMKIEWQIVYYEFLTNEPEIEPPGGGRWNDAKREGFVADRYPDKWSGLQKAKRSLRVAMLEADIITEQLRNLDRKLRIADLYNRRGIRYDCIPSPTDIIFPRAAENR